MIYCRAWPRATPPPTQAGLAEVLRYHDDQPLVQGIWGQLAAQLAVCTDCVNVRGQRRWLGDARMGAGHTSVC